MDSRHYWNEIGPTKTFDDPLFIARLEPYVGPQAHVVDYGCGYGRLSYVLKEHGFKHVMGFDFAPRMLEAARERCPEFDFELIEANGRTSCADASTDLAVLVAVLCCMSDKVAQEAVIEELYRVLKPGAVLYVSDFLVCEAPEAQLKYLEGLKEHGEWGVYTNHEGLTVRHHTSASVLRLLRLFDIQWFEQFDFRTMNGNPARVFHCIARKPLVA